ncbi:hypothetical protein [Candidatus Enterococcus clewellii]|uniref:ABC transporter Uup C-terminal domain-containing protein n=1 Tax=Candidatus Enterococcus clewellii TaxID=1834193 RepID=A0A242K865_9ENTE|nr:hypothetical protein [Enterococcus sp. 9E7_DIV0242]OTP17257.1 hypothetical protein A5888_001395 [Enterococcus sp. 9E7_DIV0242]
MNLRRKREIEKIQNEMQELLERLEEIQEEEEEYRDNMPENLQESFRYEESEEASGNLDDAYSEIESAIETLQLITE